MTDTSTSYQLTIQLSAPADDVDTAALESFFVANEAVRGVARDDDAGAVHAELHPAAEPLTVRVDAGTVTLEARTGTAGPGYHAHVCELADALAERFSLRFVDTGADADDTGFFAHRDFSALEAAFLAHARETAEALEQMARDGARGFSWGLPADHRFSHAGLLATPTGPRDETFVHAMLTDPEQAKTLFVWWTRERDAAYHRGIALSLMWTEVRWRKPLDDDERALLDDVVTHVERAHGLDPALPLPWNAQSEIFVFLGEESLRATRAHLKAQTSDDAPIGYRRQPVQVDVGGGFWMTIPGELAERWEERGTFVAWDATRSVWVTTLTLEREGPGADQAGPLDATETLVHLPPLDPSDALTFERDDLLGVVSFTEGTAEDETLEFRAEAHAAHGAHAAVGTLVFTDPEDRAFVLDTWGSILFRP